MTIIFDVVHRPEFLQNAMLWKMDLFPSSGARGKDFTSLGRLEREMD
jgi:hypothetical protein